MIPPTFSMAVDDRRLTVQFDQLDKAVRDRLRPRITALTMTLLARVRAEEPRATGLLRSRTHAYVDERTNWIRGRVRILPTGRAQQTGAAFGALEYGVNRTVHVRAHRARQTRIFGRTVDQTINIRAHPRRVHIAPRRFLRGPAARIRPRALVELRAAVSEAVVDVKRRR